MGSSNLPLSTLCILLVAVYVALTVLGRKYWLYLAQKNATKPPAEPRWTLALIDDASGEKLTYKVDIDTKRFDLETKGWLPSLRQTIEERAHSGVYLGSRHAKHLIPTLNNLVSDYKLTRSGGQIVLEPDEVGGLYSLEALRCYKSADKADDESAAPDLEIDLAPLRPQIGQLLATMLGRNWSLSEAKQQLATLSLQVVELASGEIVSEEMLVLSQNRVFKALCCNRVAEKNGAFCIKNREFLHQKRGILY